MRKLIFLFGLLSLGFSFNTFSQCGPNVPSVIVNLSSSPNATWISPVIQRNDTCCGAAGNANCVEFIITLHPNADGVIFNIASGAIPPGALYYQIGCGPQTVVGEAICLSGVGPHILTFCKPGNNSNTYSITSVSDPGVGPSIAVNDGCSGQIFCEGYDPTSISWTSITGPTGTYDSYMDCNTCETVNVTAQPGFPAFVDFQVCGLPLGGCDTIPTCDTVRVIFNSTLSATILPINPTVCFGSAGTTITANGGGGTPPYNYAWSTGDTTASIFVNIGTYIVTIGDSSGCPPTTDTVIVTSFSNPITANAGANQIICKDNLPINLSGSVTGVTTGVWTGGLGTFSPNATTLATTYNPSVNEIANGSVQLFLTTTNNGTCPAGVDTMEISIVDFTGNFFVSTNDVSCNGGADGSIVLTAFGGFQSYTYTWNTNPIQTGNSVAGLQSGLYEVTITNNFGCDSILNINISEPTVLASTISNVTNVSCTGLNNGAATVNATGGTAPYSYNWGQTSNNQTTASAINLYAGIHNVTVTDQNGCTSVSSVVITEPLTNITLSLNTIDVSCNGFSDGAAIVIASGGVPPYAYSWSVNTNNQTTSTASNLSSGTYSVVVTDSFGCVTLTGIQINEPAPISTSSIVTNVSCYGAQDGAVSLSTQGGTLPYVYYWSNMPGSVNQGFTTNLDSGIYSVSIVDGNNCNYDTLIQITEPTEIDLSTSVNNINCFGGNNGSASILPQGGTPPYAVQWNTNLGVQNGMIATNLNSGNYIVTVTDSNGCQATATVNLTQPLPLTTRNSSYAVTCFGDYNGAAFAPGSGGTPPYNYEWDANTGYQNTSIATGLPSGTYNVTVTDAHNCFIQSTIVITEPDPMTINVSSDMVICPFDTAQLQVFVNGGNGGYTYYWNQGLNNSNVVLATPLSNTEYMVYVKDSLGCTSPFDSVNVQVLNLYFDSLELYSDGNICLGEETTITGNYSGGNGNYLYEWNNNLGNNLGSFNVSPTNTTTYILTVTDQCNNYVMDSINVEVFLPPVIELPEIIATGCNPLTVIFTDTINDPNKMAYNWNFGDETTTTLAQPEHVFEGEGTYFVSVEITSLEGCVSNSDGDNMVIVNPSPVSDFTANPWTTDIRTPEINFTDLSSGMTSLVWNFGDGDTLFNATNPTHTYTEYGTYPVRLSTINQFGCTDTLELPIVIEPFYRFDAPNAFIPNPYGGNGGAYDPNSLSNEVFHPLSEYVEEFRMVVYNRWGEMVFESNDINIGWDGYYRGELSAQDVYVWKIDITYVDGFRISKAGDLTLLQ